MTPLHVGTGHAVGAVDLPLAREKTTGFPYVPGSSLKGVLREVARLKGNGFPRQKLFGPERDNASDHAGALLVSDAQLLLLPVRSLVGTFAWVTSPFLLRRLARDAREAGVGEVPMLDMNGVEQAKVAKEQAIVTADRVVFEDLDFKAETDNKVKTLAEWLGKYLFTGPGASDWQAMLLKRLCVIHDDAFAFFSLHGTEIVTRIAIDPDKKTVKKGALWTEENLPTETVMVSLVEGQSIAAPEHKVEINAEEALDQLKALLEHPVQIGGDATTGRGRCRLALAGGPR
jgi:CRISPR-associated protein Cmr4